MKRARPVDNPAQVQPNVQNPYSNSTYHMFSASYRKADQEWPSTQPNYAPESQIVAAHPQNAATGMHGGLDALNTCYPPPGVSSFNLPGQLQHLQHQQPRCQLNPITFKPPVNVSMPTMTGSSSNLNSPSGQLEDTQQHFQHTMQYSSSMAAAPSPTQVSQPAGVGGLLSQLQAQQQQQQQSKLTLRLPHDLKPIQELQRLLPKLNQEYKLEMQQLLQACRVASKVQKQQSQAAAGPTGTMLLLDPAARDQLQHQVLSNCNDKHRAVTAAFRLAAQALAAAVGSMVTTSRPSVEAAAAAAAVSVLGGSLVTSSSSNMSTLTAAAAQVTFKKDLECEPTAAVSEALEQLRSTYHQELVAATSALFAICRDFGQSSTVAPPATQPITQALAAAQQQHNRVEQLWQEILVTAADGR